ncbi:MAG: TonB-dependent receptor [Pseudomonadota bacterium]
MKLRKGIANLGVVSLTGAGALAAFSGAHAQTTESTDKAAEAAQVVETVTVTGSRVIQNGNESPAPLTVLTVVQLQATRPTTVFESLLDMPAFAGSRGGTASNPSGNQSNSNQTSALNLRGLGPVRTLILYDGHRVPPTTQDGTVNANTIPQMLLQRVDVVTGGASAVYGSDAIGGVVNFITDRKFNGVKLDVQGGKAERGYGETYRAGIAFGTKLFKGRGHFLGSFENYRDAGVLNRNDISQFQGRWTVQGAGTQAFPYFLVPGANNPTYTYGGKIVAVPGQPANPLLNSTFATNSTLRPFQNGSTAGIPTGTTIQLGGDGIWDTRVSLKPRTDLTQGYGRFDFDLTKDLHFYASFASTVDHSFNYYGDVNNSQVWRMSTSNAYFANQFPAAKAQMEAAGVSIFGLTKKFGVDSLVTNSNVDNIYRTSYGNMAFEGKIDKYKWELSYTGSKSSTEVKSNYSFDNGKLYAALDAVVNPATGQIVCNVTLTNPALYPGCVPMNPFGPSSETQALVDYVKKEGTFLQESFTNDFSGSITGAPFENWIGPVHMAISGEWHRQRFELSTDKPTVNFAPLDCTGLRFGNCTPVSATNLGTPQFNGGVAPRPPVFMTVKEAAVEGEMPLIRDLPFIESMNMNLAYRQARYDAEGNPNIFAPNQSYKFAAKTWKVGLEWEVNSAWRLRATRSQDIRAPNLNDLFQPNAVTFSNGNRDLLTNQNLTPSGGSPQIVNGGNPNLQPEVAHTVTAGVVFTPTKKFSFAIDYFNIAVKDYIFRVNGFDTAFQNACYDSGGTSYFCSLQVRPGGFSRTAPNMTSSNAVTTWYSVPANVAELKTKGVDVETNYKTTVRTLPIRLRALVSYQPHVYFTAPGSATQDLASNLQAPAGSTAGTRVRATVSAHVDASDRIGIDWQTRWRSRWHQSTNPAVVSLPGTDVASVSYSSLNLTYRLPFEGQWTAYLNVQNVFDKQAPIAAVGGNPAQSPGLAGGFVPGDDPLGRAYAVGVRARF